MSGNSLLLLLIPDAAAVHEIGICDTSRGGQKHWYQQQQVYVEWLGAGGGASLLLASVRRGPAVRHLRFWCR